MGAFRFLALLAALAVAGTACGPANNPPTGKKSIVVTYSILGSIVKELVGDAATVTVSVPNGLDPHEWESSAKDIAVINRADLVVQNGLELEGGMQKALNNAKGKGVRFFTAADHVTIRYVGPGEGIPSGDRDQAIGAPDPHLWTDPLEMKSVVAALSAELKQDFDIDTSARATSLEGRLDALDRKIKNDVAQIAPENRKLVTGHESMGYFAQRYGFKLVGVIIPSLSSQAGVSAGDLAALTKAIQENRVKAIFTELGTSPAVAKAVADATGVKVVELTTHALPPDGSYFTFITDIANVITGALK